MEKLTITVFIPNEDFKLFLECYKIVCDLPHLECDYTFNGDEIRVYEEKMHRPICKQINIPVMDYIKWQYYHNKNKKR